MGFLARTFRAQWRKRGGGYYLDAGAEADRDEPPPARAGSMPGGIWPLMTLAVLVGSGLGWLVLRRRGGFSLGWPTRSGAAKAVARL